MSVLSQMSDVWTARSLRERRMLMLMVFVIMAVALGLGVVRPLHSWQGQTAREVVQAQQRLGQIKTALAHRGAGRPDGFNLQTLVTQSAADQGIEPVLAMSEGGHLGFQLDRVTTNRAFGWLEALETGGAKIETLGVIKNPDGTLAITGELS